MIPRGANNAAGGKNWALLIAGSNTYGNYRHQADIYHMYQVIKKNGIPDNQIIVFHYDDIANNTENPHKGTVINHPTILTNVYEGVPKDYTGSNVNPTNILAVLGGSAADVKCTLPGECGKKVLATGADDHIFVMFDDHGGAGILGMPDGVAYLYAKDINAVLKKKAAAKGFAQLAFYIEACEAGSIFDGLLPANINIYATTASNPSESSWGCYCPGMVPPPPAEYETCLGDLYAVSISEHADATDEKKETLLGEYGYLKTRVSQNGTFDQGSHVMQYGEVSIDSEVVDTFLGSSAFSEYVPLSQLTPKDVRTEVVNTRDADLLWLQTRHSRATGARKEMAAKELNSAILKRQQVDTHVSKLVENLGFNLTELMTTFSTPVVEDWECYKASVEHFNTACVRLGEYGMKYGRALANLCNAGINIAASNAQCYATPSWVAMHGTVEGCCGCDCHCASCGGACPPCAQ